MAAYDPEADEISLKATQMASEDERRAWLNEACAGQPELRRAVEVRLQTREEATSSAVASLPGDGGSPDGPSHAGIAVPFAATVIARDSTESAGARVGPYKLLQQIGEGGFGVVYMAEQEQPVRRTVALKIIKPGMDSREVIARFEVERQALALMDHQNIARVLDAGTTDSGRPFFVMELVRGIPITEYCNNNRLTPRERLELFAPVCHAIQHAHQKGIIHRDIKPSNVLVCLYDGKPVPKVIDFGVAKAIEQRLTEKTMFTRYGQVVGTLEYMSPEQAESSQLDIDTRSDVYSLGVLLYELLTGTTPITREQLRQASLVEMLRLIRESEPERPSLRLSRSQDILPAISAQRRTEPAKLSAILRGELDWVVMKALEKNRTRRYETALGLARDIERHLRDEPVEACPPSVAYRMRKLMRRHRGAVVSGSAIAVLLLALLVSFFVGYFQLKQARGQALRDATRAQRAEAAALSTLEDVRTQQRRAEAAERAARIDRDRAVAAEAAAEQQRKLEVQSRQRAMEALARSQFEQARVVRLAGQPGRRWIGLELLQQSEAIRAQAPLAHPVADTEAFSVLPLESELRTEAIAALLTSDGRAARQLPGYTHAISPNGRYAASAAIEQGLHDVVLTVTDVSTGGIREWKGAEAQAMSGVSIAISSDGATLAALSPDMRQIGLWRLRDRQGVRMLAIPSGSPNGNAATPAEVPVPPGRPRLVRQLMFSPDGHMLTAVAMLESGETGVVLWSVDGSDAGQVIASIPHFPTVTAAFSPDSRRVAFATGGQNVIVWDLVERRAAAEIALPLRTDGAIGFHPGGQHVGVHCRDSNAQSVLLLWDVAENREVARIGTSSIGSTIPVAFTLDGHRAAVAGVDGTLVLCDVPPSPHVGQRPALHLDHGSMPQTVAWSVDGALLTGGLAGLKQWELAAADAVAVQRLEWDQKPGHFGRLAFSPDGRAVAVTPWHGGEVVVFDRITGTGSGSLGGVLSFDPAVSIRYSPDGAQIFRHGASGVVAWDVRSGAETLRLAPHTTSLSTVTSLGFRTDGSVLAAGMYEMRASVRDVATGQTIWSPAEGQPAMAAVSPNGEFALTFRAFALEGDVSIPVWDLTANQLRFTLPGPEGKVLQSLAEISPDSRWVLALHYAGDVTKSLSRGMPGTANAAEAPAAPRGVVPPAPVQLVFGPNVANSIAADQAWIGDVWNGETGQRHLQLAGPSTVETYAFSPNGRYLAVGMRNQSIRLWDVDAARELFDWRPAAATDGAPFSPRHLAFSADSSTLAAPDPVLPALHLLDLRRLNAQLTEWSLGW